MFMIEKLKNIFKRKPQLEQTLIKEFIIDRFYSLNGEGDTIGIMTHKDQFFCYTLERPYIVQNIINGRDNPNTKENESCCIPAGEYFADFTYSNNFKKVLYCLIGTGKRTMIRIHIGNTQDDVKGCILLGERMIRNVKHLGKSYNFFLGSSEKAINKFHNICKGERIKIIIRDQNQTETFSKFKFE